MTVCHAHFRLDSAFHVELRPQYSYLVSTPLLMAFGIGITALKFKEGSPTLIYGNRRSSLEQALWLSPRMKVR